MKHSRTSIGTCKEERGSALIAVLLLLMMVSALVAALSVSGQTETFISRNQRANAQAHAAAEAGLNHAVQLATSYIFDWSTNGFGSVDGAVDALLLGPDGASGGAADADNGSLGTRPGITAAEDIPLGTRLALGGGVNAQYEAVLMDDDASAPDENGSLVNDTNGKIVIRATGYAQDNTRVTLEAIIDDVDLGAVGALVVDGDVNITGSVHVLGDGASVHANGDLDVGGSADVDGPLTASGTYTGSDPGQSGAPMVDLPEIKPSNFKHLADFVLTSDGRMTNLAGAVICAADPCNNWSFDGTGWSFGGSEPPAATYYVEGDVRITSHPELQITIIAEGSIDIQGNPEMVADTPELLLVAGGDLEISGGLDLGLPVKGEGRVLVHEQIKFSGNPAIRGQVLVENAESMHDLVTENTLSGNVDIEYNGGLGPMSTGDYTVVGWREVR